MKMTRLLFIIASITPMSLTLSTGCVNVPVQTLLPVQIKRLAIDHNYIISIDIDENLTNEQVAQIQAGVVEYVKNNLITRVL